MSVSKAGPRGLLKRLSGAAKSVVYVARGKHRQKKVPAPADKAGGNQNTAVEVGSAQPVKAQASPAVDTDCDPANPEGPEDWMVSMGFESCEARAALRANGYDVQRAVEMLLHSGVHPTEGRHDDAARPAAQRIVQDIEAPGSAGLRAAAADRADSRPDPDFRRRGADGCAAQADCSPEVVSWETPRVAPKTVPQVVAKAAAQAAAAQAAAHSAAQASAAQAAAQAAKQVPPRRPHWSCSNCGEENADNRSACNNCRKAKSLVATCCDAKHVQAETARNTSSSRAKPLQITVTDSQVLADEQRSSSSAGKLRAMENNAWGMSNLFRQFVTSSVAPVTGCSMASLSEPTRGGNSCSRSSFIASSLPTAEDADMPGISEPRQLSQVSRSCEDEEGEVVWLNIYDVSGGTTQWVNDLIRPLGTGAFHAGVEVYGQEWSYGYNAEGSGVYCSKPRSSGQHKYRESVAMGATKLSKAAARDIIAELRKEWNGAAYELLVRNCCHFSDALCRGLGVGPIPEWVMHLAGAGKSLADGVDQAVARANAAGLQALVKAGELDEKYRISGRVDSFLMKEVEVDEEKIGAAVHDMWEKTVESFKPMGALAKRVYDQAMQPMFSDRTDRATTSQDTQSAFRLPPSPTRGQRMPRQVKVEDEPSIQLLFTERVLPPRAASAQAEEERVAKPAPSLHAVTPEKPKKPAPPATPDGLSAVPPAQSTESAPLPSATADSRESSVPKDAAACMIDRTPAQPADPPPSSPHAERAEAAASNSPFSESAVTLKGDELDPETEVIATAELVTPSASHTNESAESASSASRSGDSDKLIRHGESMPD